MTTKSPSKAPSGAALPGAWGQQQKAGLEMQDRHAKENAQGNRQPDQRQQSQGDDRTPDQQIGQVAYANNAANAENKQQGGAGEPQTTPLEPEKQGGIGGP